MVSVDENKLYMDRNKGVDILENLFLSIIVEGFYYLFLGNIIGICDWYVFFGCFWFGYKGFYVGNGK